MTPQQIDGALADLSDSIRKNTLSRDYGTLGAVLVLNKIRESLKESEVRKS